MYARNHITPDSALGGWQMKRSLRWEGTTGGTYSYLYRTGSSPTGGGKYSYSSWIKRGDLSYQTCLWGAGGGSQTNSHAEGIYITSSDQIALIYRGALGGGSVGWYAYSKNLIRDCGSWYHIMLTYDNNQSGISNKIKYYFNGVEVPYYSGVGSPGDLEYVNKSGVTQYIGRMDQGSGPGAARVYQAETHVADGYIWTPSDFGYTDAHTGQWRPKRPEDISVDYGNNGFYLDYADNTSTSTIGIDKSGNSNNWTASGFSVSAGADNDSVTDTPTNNFPTFNPLDKGTVTLSDGNLKATQGAAHETVLATVTISSGKWYWEVTCGNANESGELAGIGNNSGGILNSHVGSTATSWGYETTGYLWNNSNSTTGNATLTTGDILGIAYDADAGVISYYKNNSLQPNKHTGITANNYSPMVSLYHGSAFWTINFGQQPFSYTPPTGYRSLSGKNRATPLAAGVVNPKRHFAVINYSGNGSTNKITGLEFKPDCVWSKVTNATGQYSIFDSVRGATKRLGNGASGFGDVVETTVAASLQSFDENGFTFGAEAGNNNGENYTAWCWKAGGTAVSNTDGDITSSVSVNKDAGFSIATYTGSTANGALTVGHGLGKKPAFVIIRRRDDTGEWIVGHQALATNAFANNKFLKLDSTNSTFTNSLVFGVEPTTTVTQIVTDGNAGAANLTSSGTYVMYSWAEIPGYSAFGRYKGNGGSVGSYVHLGFRPAFLILKRIDDSKSWILFDNKRSPSNLVDKSLYPNKTDVENNFSNLEVDFLSNGFKLRNSVNTINGSGGTFVYMAFAEQSGQTPYDTFPNAR